MGAKMSKIAALVEAEAQLEAAKEKEENERKQAILQKKGLNTMTTKAKDCSLDGPRARSHSPTKSLSRTPRAANVSNNFDSDIKIESITIDENESDQLSLAPYYMWSVEEWLANDTEGACGVDNLMSDYPYRLLPDDSSSQIIAPYSDYEKFDCTSQSYFEYEQEQTKRGEAYLKGNYKDDVTPRQPESTSYIVYKRGTGDKFNGKENKHPIFELPIPVLGRFEKVRGDKRRTRLNRADINDLICYRSKHDSN